LSWTHGAHQVKFGADIQFDRFLYRDNANSGGAFTFDGSITKDAFADFLIGRATRLAQASPVDTDHRSTVQGYFIQDTWKAAPRVTVSLGMRWEMYPIWGERYGKMTSCGCDNCNNFAQVRDQVYPPEVLTIFDSLGIDFRKESEVHYYGRTPAGLHTYR